MLMKYIEANCFNRSKNYNFTVRDLIFDKSLNSIILSKEYINNDMEHNLSYVYGGIFYNELLDRKLYSSLSNVERAIRTGSLEAYLSITYCTDINKSDSGYMIFRDEVHSLKDVEKYCSGVRYYYELRTKEISRYEVYGDIVLGDEIHREESYYDQFKFNII